MTLQTPEDANDAFIERMCTVKLDREKLQMIWMSPGLSVLTEQDLSRVLQQFDNEYMRRKAWHILVGNGFVNNRLSLVEIIRAGAFDHWLHVAPEIGESLETPSLPHQQLHPQ